MVHFILQYLFCIFYLTKLSQAVCILERNGKNMIGYYNYTVILTYIGMISGFMGITYIWNQNVKMALICLMFSGLCDMFDGKIASTMDRTKQEKRFGIQIDSLSDLICFGVLPAMIVLHCSAGKFLPVPIAAFYLLCTLIRLAWFNVDEEERQTVEACGRTCYLGLPVTSSALIFPLFIGIGTLLKLSVNTLLPYLLLGTAIGFLVPFSLKKPAFQGKLTILVLGIIDFIMVWKTV